MNVIRVVVDELPEGCMDCVFFSERSDPPFCDAFGMDIYADPVELESNREGWCPLVKEGEE